MFKKVIKLAALLLICFVGLTQLQATTTINVREKNGNQATYPLQEIRKITFSSGIILINKEDGASDSFSLSEIRYLNFGNYQTKNESVTIRTGTLLYPNPVEHVVNLRFPIQISGNIQIISLDGKILHRQLIDNKSLDIQLNVSNLNRGFYLCVINNGTNIETIKFNKL